MGVDISPDLPPVPASDASGAFIGLDIGGSKTRGIKVVDGQVVADHRVGSANVQNTTREDAARQLADLFAVLGADGVSRVIAGSGGIDTEEDKRALAGLISPHVPGARISIVHDSWLILAAGRARTGIAVIAGTGSAAWGINAEGVQARAGGWGYLLGDEGSGYWFGREAVRYSLRRMNQGQEPDALSLAVLERCGLQDPNDLIRLFHGDKGRHYWASLGSVVFDAATAGHQAAAAMIEQGGTDLAALAAEVAGQLGLTGPVIIGGGVGENQPALQDAFRRHLAAAGCTDVRVLDADPVFGTLFLAEDPAFA